MLCKWSPWSLISLCQASARSSTVARDGNETIRPCVRVCTSVCVCVFTRKACVVVVASEIFFFTTNATNAEGGAQRAVGQRELVRCMGCGAARGATRSCPHPAKHWLSTQAGGQEEREGLRPCARCSFPEEMGRGHQGALHGGRRPADPSGEDTWPSPATWLPSAELVAEHKASTIGRELCCPKCGDWLSRHGPPRHR